MDELLLASMLLQSVNDTPEDEETTFVCEIAIFDNVTYTFPSTTNHHSVDSNIIHYLHVCPALDVILVGAHDARPVISVRVLNTFYDGV